jgi:hypothetical protein
VNFFGVFARTAHTGRTGKDGSAGLEKQESGQARAQRAHIASRHLLFRGKTRGQRTRARLCCYDCGREIARARKPKLEFCNSVCVRVVPDRKQPVHDGVCSLARCQ